MFMLLTLLPSAHAIPGAFDCTAWESAADAWDQAYAMRWDAYLTRTGADGVWTIPYNTVLARVYEQAEPGCPYYNDGGDLLIPGYDRSLTDSCTTSAGTTIEWSRVATDGGTSAMMGSWDITLTYATGDTLHFEQASTGRWVSGHDGRWYEYDDWTWSAEWTGWFADGWPDDGWVQLSGGTYDYSSNYLDGSWTRAYSFAWASPSCDWSASFQQSYDVDVTTSWSLDDGASVLDVDGQWSTTVCGERSLSATLDGVVTDVTYEGWSPLTDSDGDGYCAEIDDCADGAASVHPGARDRPYDHLDQDCDGADLVDVDADGHAGTRAGGDDCNDFNARVHPGAPDLRRDGIDQDCDGLDGK